MTVKKSASGKSKKVDIGAPSVTGVDAHVEAAVLAEDQFPQDRVIVNNTRSKLVFPSVDRLLAPFGGKANVTFKNADHLAHFVTDAEQLCELNGWKEGIVIKSLEQDAEDTAAAKAKVEPQAAKD